MGVNNLGEKYWKFLWFSICLFLCFLNLKVIAPFVSGRGYWNSDAVGVGLSCGWGGLVVHRALGGSDLG